MKNKISKILVVGDVMLDKYVIGQHNRQSPEADCAIIDYERTELRLGGAANVAYNLKKINQDVSLISIIGNDKEGDQLIQLCNQNNIPVYLTKDESRPTTVKTRYVDSKFKQYLRVDNESREPVSSDIEDCILSQIKQSTHNEVDLILIQDYNKGLLSKAIISEIQKICKQKNIKLSVDPKSDNFLQLSECDLFKPNLKELSQQYGKPISANSKEINRAIKELKLQHAQQIFVTLAEKGIYYQEGDDYGIIEGISLESADVSGAGDTVISVLSTLLIYDIKTDIMATIANKCGVFVCKKQGVSYINMADFQTFISESE
jgi:rfaE bifunctional protein kinase chain/domain